MILSLTFTLADTCLVLCFTGINNPLLIQGGAKIKQRVLNISKARLKHLKRV